MALQGLLTVSADTSSFVFISGKSLDAVYAVMDDPFTRVNIINITNSQLYISAVASTDFDGDSVNDIALIMRKSRSSTVTVQVYWGIVGGHLVPEPTTINVEFRDEPIICDLNADWIPELFGENSNGDRVLYGVDRYSTFEDVIKFLQRCFYQFKI